MHHLSGYGGGSEGCQASHPPLFRLLVLLPGLQGGGPRPGPGTPRAGHTAAGYTSSAGLVPCALWLQMWVGVSIPGALASGPRPFRGEQSGVLLVTLLSHGEWNEFRGQESVRTHKKQWHKTFSRGEGIRSASTLSEEIRESQQRRGQTSEGESPTTHSRQHPFHHKERGGTRDWRPGRRTRSETLQ